MAFSGWIPDKQVRDTPEVRRIAALPTRTWTEQTSSGLSVSFSAALRRPGSKATLFPVQAQALNDAGIYRGLFGNIRVGGGKTLLSFLLPVVCFMQKPLLLVPASIKDKTKREMLVYAKDWNIPVPRIRIETYEALGRDGQKHLLENYRPDGLICDEVHRLKNHKAAGTRRVMRYMGDNPDTVFCGFSGTITKRSLKDYAHILRWVFGDGTPLPRSFTELEEWCAAIDEKTNPLALTLDPGAIISVLGSSEDIPGEDQSLTGVARRTVRRRVSTTPGVVATVDGFSGCPLYVNHIWNEESGDRESDLCGFMDQARRNNLTPDGWFLPDGLSVAACVKQLALGFFYRYKVEPPEPWKILRQAWNRTVREWIKHPPSGVHFDTKFQVEQAMSKGQLPDHEGVYAKWREIEPSYEPETIAVWLDDGLLKQCCRWLNAHKNGICWVEYGAFGNALSAMSGISFYRNQGKDQFGRSIEQATGPIIASVASNSTGRNLQRWDENLVVQPSPNALQIEQRIGRTHREGQLSDQVTDTYLISCREHVDALARALLDARYTEDSTGQSQKILHADLDLPEQDDINRRQSRRYSR